MTPEQMGRLFQEFSQTSRTTARNTVGSGLGLAISKRFCQMMGGDITVERARLWFNVYNPSATDCGG
jgi:signal transduction histidine kinase